MAIHKPGWLRNWLNKLNFDIFTWKLYIGDWLEFIVDWLLGWINWAIYQAERAYNKALSAWDKAVEVYYELSSIIYFEVWRLSNRIDSLWFQLAEWWQALKPEILAWIDLATQSLLGAINDAKTLAGMALSALQDFRKEVYSRFIPFSWIRDFYGGDFSSISDWWSIKRKELEDAIGVTIDAISSEVNQISKTVDEVKGFLSNPLEWLWGRFTDWFLGAEE